MYNKFNSVSKKTKTRFNQKSRKKNTRSQDQRQTQSVAPVCP